MTPEENKELAKRMLDWWVSGDVSVIDETVDAKFVSHTSDGGEFRGRDVYKERLSGFIELFSDRQIAFEDFVAEADRVAVRYSWSGITTSGRPVSSHSMAIYRIAGGRIAEEWEEHNTASLAKQTTMS